MNLEGKKALVTGGTRGIGRATVEALLQAGARVAINGSSGLSVATALASLGANENLVAAPGDISQVMECQRVVENAAWGVVNLTRDLAIELAPDIRVNCICPGAVDTEMLQDVGRFLGNGDVALGYAILTQNRPMKRVARPAEIAKSILYLASDSASFITGSIHVVDGGVMAKAG